VKSQGLSLRWPAGGREARRTIAMSLKLRSLGLMGSAARGILITGGTNATPIVATITAGHRLKDGDRIAIAGVTTLTAMNGDFSVDTVAATRGEPHRLGR
jgi:hypothetical protein